MKIVFVCLFLFVLTFSIFAQEKRLVSSPQAFRQFFAKFKSAVKRNDQSAIILMTRFPFKYGFDAGDEGAMTRAEFLKSYDKRFAESLKSAVNEKNSLFSVGGKGLYIVSTEDAAHLSFVKSGGSFKFISYIVEP